MTERFSSRRLPQPEFIGQLPGSEDVVHLSIAVIDAGKLAPDTLQRRGLRGVKLSECPDAREGHQGRRRQFRLSY